ncbi:MAG: alpha/beta hydrolase, partial [Candidatus Heimdallarchaeota archaeon]|nr:alpha/beta hydrolase [Candidatus Heimdallarchaeota archaeon]MCK5048588.1 alpha/beta hydrolase [Candidatus Heimdallarchaeota archaeon]
FERMMPDLAADWDTYAIDFRGHGKSDRAETYYFSDYMNDILEFIKSEMKEPVTIIGHSLGGMVTLFLAGKIPENLRAIIIEDSPLPFYKKKSEYEEKENLKQLLIDLKQVVESGMTAVPEDELLTLFSQQLPDAPKEFIQKYVEVTLQRDDNAMKSVYTDFETTFAGYYHDQLFPKITCPVLLLQADTSLGALMLDEDVKRTIELLENVTHQKFDKINHNMHFFIYEPVFEAIKNFLDTLE